MLTCLAFKSIVNIWQLCRNRVSKKHEIHVKFSKLFFGVVAVFFHAYEMEEKCNCPMGKSFWRLCRCREMNKKHVYLNQRITG